MLPSGIRAAVVAEALAKEVQVAARTLLLESHVLQARNELEIGEVFASLLRLRAGGLVIGADSLFSDQGGYLAALALRHAVPAISEGREFVTAGGLMSYAGNIPDSFRAAGVYVGRILKGEKPADPPVQQSTTVELMRRDCRQRWKPGMTPLTIPRLNINIMGGIQPDVLSALIKGPSTGFLNRFLWAWPDIVPGFKMPRTGIDNKPQVEALKRIFELDMEDDEFGRRPSKIGFAQSAIPIFEAFVERNRARESFGMMKATIGKGPAQVVRLAMVLSLLDWSHKGKAVAGIEAPEPIVIAKQYVENAIKLVEGYFYPMAERTFQEASLPEVDVRARQLIQWVHKQGLEKFNAKVTRYAMGGELRKDHRLMDDACQALVDAHLIKADPARRGSRPGQKTKDFVVNPLLLAATPAAAESAA